MWRVCFRASGPSACLFAWCLYTRRLSGFRFMRHDMVSVHCLLATGLLLCKRCVSLFDICTLTHKSPQHKHPYSWSVNAVNGTIYPSCSRAPQQCLWRRFRNIAMTEQWSDFHVLALFDYVLRHWWDPLGTCLFDFVSHCTEASLFLASRQFVQQASRAQCLIDHSPTNSSLITHSSLKYAIITAKLTD